MKYFDYLKSIVYIQQIHMWANSRKSTFPIIDHQKNLKFLDKSIYFWLPFESYCFHGHA